MESTFLKEDIQYAIKNLKNNKASSENKTNEQIKYGGKALIRTITILCNDILENHLLPEQRKRLDNFNLQKRR